MKTLWIYIWYFFTESETFEHIMIATAFFIAGMTVERAW